jgi:hypothetical protein
VNYNCNCSFIVLATVIMIVNYDHKTFIVQATDYVTLLKIFNICFSFVALYIF